MIMNEVIGCWIILVRNVVIVIRVMFIIEELGNNLLIILLILVLVVRLGENRLLGMLVK